MMLSLLLAALLVASASAGPTCNIGVVAPLTGELAASGTAMVNGARLAAKEFNSAEASLKITTYNSQCTGTLAAAAAVRAIDIDKVVGVIGDYCSGASLAMAVVLNAKKVPGISIGTSPRLTLEGGEFLSRTAPSDTYQGPYLGNAIRERGALKVAILYSLDAYGESIAHEVFVALTKTGAVSVVAAVGFSDAWTTGLLGPVIAKGADSVVIASTLASAQLDAARELRSLGFRGQIYGPDGLSVVPPTGDGAVLSGAVSSVPFLGTDAFKAKYEKEYGTPPPFGAAGAYDAARLFLRTCVSGGKVQAGQAIQTSLLTTTLFNGAQGQVKLDKNGDLRNAKYDLLEAKAGQWTLLDN